MAENHAPPAGYPAVDYTKHETTHWLFRRLMKYTAPGAALIIALPACFRG
jgi:hypothetical protein